MTEVVLTKPTYTESAISSATMTEVSAYSKNNTELVNAAAASFTENSISTTSTVESTKYTEAS
jgi:hypothetical protein